MKDLSILDSLDSYLDGFEMRLSEQKQKEVRRERDVVMEEKVERRPIRRSASPSKKIEEKYDVVEEVVVVKRTKPKVKKIVETDEDGNILNIRYEEINESRVSTSQQSSQSSESPPDLFGRIGAILDETPYDVNASGSYVSESVGGQPVESGASDLFIPAPLRGPIADFK